MERRNIAVFVFLGILVVAICVWAFRRIPDQAVETAQLQDTNSPTQREYGIARDAGHLERQAVVAPSIAVVARDSRKPLTAASLTVLPANVESTLRTEPVAFADASGVVRSEVLPARGAKILIRSPGHIPSALDGDIVEPCEVALEPAGQLDITVIDSNGRTVSDAWISLSSAVGTKSFLSQSSVPLSGIGHPLSERPVWLAVTESLGRASFTELPSQRMFLNVLHRDLIPLDRTGVNSTVDVVIGRTALTVTMQIPYAVVFHCPSASPIRDVCWNVNVLALDHQPQVMSRLAMMHQSVQERFPECLVYVHKPARPTFDLLVRCRVACADATYWVGEWPMKPVDSIQEPVFLEQDLTPAREILFVLKDSEGVSHGDVAFALVSDGEERRIDGVTGERVVVPYGEYKVLPKILSAAIWQAFLDRVIKVDANGPNEFVLTAPEPLAEVIVTPKLPSEEVLAPLEIYFANENGQGPAVANWIPARGPIRRLLAAKQISLRVRSVAYEDVDIPAKTIEPRVPLEIEVALRAKPGR